MAALPHQDVQDALRALPGWRLVDGAIVKSYKFASFMDAISFITRLAEKAEDLNHHPDIENHYNRVRVSLHTWSESAITAKDIALAREIESVAEEPGA